MGCWIRLCPANHLQVLTLRLPSRTYGQPGSPSGPVLIPGTHRIRSVRSGADSPEAYPVSGPVRCHIPKSVFRAIRSGLVSGLVLVFTDPVSGPSGRRFCVPPDPAGSGAVHYPVQRGLSDFSLASALPVVPHRVPARWVSAEHGAAPTARCSGPNYSTHHGAIDRAEKSCT